MSLSAGTRLGPYEVIALLGEGGMGQVYRARDTKLGRDVALKVLPESVAHDTDRLARLTREAQTLAALNHPNVAQIHGFEESGRVRALVMELVEGEDLAQRLVRGALPLDEALPVALQIAEALEAAHEQGIVHRDLKPANIKVRPDGTVKVLDFGLAKAMDKAGEAAGSPSLSPTLTSPAMTAAGVIIGTAAYMSPEQARGKPVDKRADVWAFGCVLYEMLTGHRAFKGESVADVFAGVMTQEPDLMRPPAGVSAAVVALLRRCLQKDPRKRLRDIGDALAALENNDERGDSRQASTSRTGVLGSRALPWIAAALGLGFGLWTVVAGQREPTSAPRALTQVNAMVGADVSLRTDQGPAAVLSPDGSTMVFSGRKAGEVRQLYVRRLNQLEAVALPGTAEASAPFFSPDGQWIAFFSTGKLKKVPVGGGPVVVLCDAPSGRGGSWSADGWIAFTPRASGGTTITRVSANGGTPEPVTRLRDGEAAQRWPQVLPGGKGVLYSTSLNLGNYNDGEVVVQPLPTGEPKIIVKGGFFGRYQRSGHLT